MTDTTQTPAPKKRAAIADRAWLNAAGEEISTGSADVAGVRYTYLKTGNSVEYILGQNEQLDRQFAAMGAVTKLGNVVNSETKGNPDWDGVTDPIPAVVAWLDAATKGEWREEGEGVVRGPKYDKDILAAVIVAVLGASAAGDVMHYRQKLEDKSYYAKVRAKTKIMAEYHAELGRRGQAGDDSVDDLA